MTFAAILAAITAALQDLPLIGQFFSYIGGLITKTTAQQAADAATNAQDEQNQIDKTGRPQ
jgi:hypothetical protein